ncbi:DNA polymerase alpha subunit B-like isoform X2 [Babylonia areolata]|uniref:DNA polymerase alpha subunit B-like isoform X2 n=1 Tax=Babylonia areolata TaxID=304850 RepID=UPI003FD520E7
MPSITDDALSEEFELFGVDLSDEFYPRLRELCSLFRQDEGQIAQEWIAFKCSRNVNSMTMSTLEKFEREWLPKKGLKPPKREDQTVKSGLANRIGDDDVDMISMYASSTPTDTGKTAGKRQVTPDERDALRKRLADSERSPVVSTRPSASPSGGAKGLLNTSVLRSNRFAERKAAGEVVCSFGAADNAVWKGRGKSCVIAPYHPTKHLDKPYKYMFQKLADQADALNDQVVYMEELLRTHLGLEELPPVGQACQDTVQLAGRVACDSQGRLNSQSVVLEGSRDTSIGVSIPVDLSDLKDYALFPGQVIAADAMNPTGKKLRIKNIYPSIKLPFPQLDIKTEPGSSLVVMVAAGPFSVSDDLYYDPLRALLDTIRKDQPDVCILMGPFVDIKNSIIEGGRMDETYDQTFRKCMELIAEDTQKLNCEIVVVPSWRDAHHDPVYPQGPFTWTHKPQHLHFVSDPCTLVVNNVVFGITSTDILLHLGAEEVSLCPPGSTDRLGRLAQHLLDQHSYYPLYPPSEDINADLQQFEDHVRMSVIPHVLIVPSDLRYFIKDCSGCCCVNPGRLAKGQVGGTYARLLLHPPTFTEPTSLVSSTAGQILKI